MSGALQSPLHIFKALHWLQSLYAHYNLIMAPPYRAGTLSVDGRRLNVCPIPDRKLGMEERGKLKVGRTEAHDTGDR